MQACVLLKRAKDAVDRFQDSMPDLLLSRPHCYDLQVRFGGVDHPLVVSTTLRVSLFKGDGTPVTAATCDAGDQHALSGETTFHVLWQEDGDLFGSARFVCLSPRDPLL